MTTLACLRAIELAGRARINLDEAERLRLEEHLGRCPRCAADVALLDGAADRLRASGPPDTALHARAFARAWSKRDVPLESARPRESVGGGRKLAAVSALAAAAAALFFVFGTDREAARSSLPAVASLPNATEGTPVEERTLAGTLSLEAGDDLEVAGAILIAIEPSTFELDPEATTVRIVRGAMRFEVEPGRTVPFSVESDAVRVEVLGTVFEVEGDEVRVERGRVRASTLTGASAVVLGAGEEWSVSAVEHAAIEPEPAASAVASASAPVQAIEARASLARARRHLASGEVAEAKGLVQRVLSLKLSPSLDAEARTLLAECALVGGDPKEAARRYAEVASKHGDSAAGENALFAAARAAQSSGQRDEAKRLLEQYLGRYPSGQFVNEAQRRLAQLAQTTSGGKK
jgi:TolA-binding protein